MANQTQVPRMFDGDANSVIGIVERLAEKTRLIPTFQVRPEVKMLWDEAIDAYEAGQEAFAVHKGNEVIEATRNLFGAFLRGSIIGKFTDDQTRPGFFANKIAKRKEEFYDDDIVAWLAKKLEDAVTVARAETNGTFDGRVQAYLDMSAAISKADKDQAKLDAKRLQNVGNFTPAEGQEPTTVQKRVAKLYAPIRAAEEKRQAEEEAKAKRTTVAKSARNLFVNA